MEKERTGTVTLQHASIYWKEGCMIFRCKDKCFKINVNAFDKSLNRDRSMMVSKYFANQIMLNFTKGILDVE